MQQLGIADSEDKRNGVVEDWHGGGALDGHLDLGFHCIVRFILLHGLAGSYQATVVLLFF